MYQVFVKELFYCYGQISTRQIIAWISSYKQEDPFSEVSLAFSKSSPSASSRTWGPAWVETWSSAESSLDMDPHPQTWVESRGLVPCDIGLQWGPRPYLFSPRPVCFFLARSRKGWLDLVLGLIIISLILGPGPLSASP